MLIYQTYATVKQMKFVGQMKNAGGGNAEGAQSMLVLTI